MIENAMVSIIIPVYNVGKYIGKCLESCVTQTYQNLEIICVYDPSSDNSLFVLEEFAKKDGRIKVIKNGKRGGLSLARNLGFNQAKGKYIYYLDGDDYIKINAMEKLYAYAERYGTECIFFNSDTCREAEGLSAPIVRHGLKSISEQIQDGPSLYKIFMDNNVYSGSPWSRFWSKDFLTKNNLIFENELWKSEEIVFCLKAILLGKRMMAVDEVYHVYRRHGESGSVEFDAMYMICQFKAYCNLLDFWGRHQFGEDIDRRISNYLKNILVRAKRVYFRTRSDICENDFREGIERHLFQTLVEQEYERRLDHIDDFVLENISKYKKVIVYGAGLNAYEAVEKLERKNIHVDSLAVTCMYGNVKGINGILVHEIKDLCYMKDEAIIILGVNRPRREEVIQVLKKYEFSHYITLDGCCCD